MELTWYARHAYSPVSFCVTLLMSKPSARMRNLESSAAAHEWGRLEGKRAVSRLAFSAREFVAHYGGPVAVLTSGADGLSVEVPGDIRLGLALYLAQDGGLVALLNGHHGGIFRECNFLCWRKGNAAGRQENNAILMTERPTTQGDSQHLRYTIKSKDLLCRPPSAASQVQLPLSASAIWAKTIFNCSEKGKGKVRQRKGENK